MKLVRATLITLICLLYFCAICNAQKSYKMLHDTYDGSDFITMYNLEMIKNEFPYRFILKEKGNFKEKENSCFFIGVLDHCDINTNFLIIEENKKLRAISIMTDSSKDFNKSYEVLKIATIIVGRTLGMSSNELKDSINTLTDATKYGTAYFNSFSAKRRFVINYSKTNSEPNSSLIEFTILAESYK